MSDTSKERLQALVAPAGPAVVLVATALVTLSPQPSRHRALISLWVTLFFNVALLLSFGQAWFDGTRAEPKVIRWLNGVGAGGRTRLYAAGARYALLLTVGFAILFAMKRVIRLKLDYDSALVIAGAFAALVLCFELLGWWLSGTSARVRRMARIAVTAWGAVALIHTFVEAAAEGVIGQIGPMLYRFVDGGPWRWFPFSGWVNGIYQHLIQGERPPWLALGAAVVCGVAGVVMYARHPSES
jgi:hypothetical protein